MKKKVVKRLRQIANELPEMHYWGYPKKYVKEYVTSGDPPIARLQMMVKKSKVKYKVNHLRRLKRAVTLHGMDKGVEIHMRWMLGQLDKTDKKLHG